MILGYFGPWGSGPRAGEGFEVGFWKFRIEGSSWSSRLELMRGLGFRV